MLKYDTLPREQGAEEAAKVRVTAEELANAITTLEAKKQEEARRLEDTVVIGDAIQDLQIEVTPEEVLAEVIAQREAAKLALPPDTSLRERKHPAVWIFGIGGVLAVIGGIVLGTFNAPPQAQMRPSSARTTPSVSRLDVNVIANIPNRQPFYCLPSEVEEVIEGTPLSQIPVVVAQGRGVNPPWKMVKHHGQVYLHGWTSAKAKTLAAGTANVLIYNFEGEKAAPQDFTPVTLRLSALQYLGFYTRLDTPFRPAHSQQEILSIAKVHLDKYAWEKW